ERRPARRRALEPFELADERLLGRRLRQRLERRVDPEAALLEILVVVVPPKLAADEIQERGIVRGAPALYGDDAELSILCIRERYRIDQAGIAHRLEHERAPRERPLGISARIVERRAAHDRDEQRDLVHVELGERLAEIEAAREPESVHRTCAVLAETDLVDVREHDLVLAVPELQHERHERFADLARVGLTARKEIAPD